MQATEPTQSGDNLANVENVKKEGSGSTLLNGRCKTTGSSESIRVIRQYVNPAVYVESSICQMAPLRRSPLYVNYASDDEAIQNKVVKVKKCVCFSNPKNCPCHPSSAESSFRESARSQSACITINNSKSCENYGTDHRNGDIDKIDLNNLQDDSCAVLNQSLSTQAMDEINTSVNLCDSRSQISINNFQDELKLSLESTSILSGRCMIDKDREETFKNWCARKNHQKKLQEEKEALIREIKEREKELQLQQERENFKRWLFKKKMEEAKKQKEIQDQIKKEKMLEEEKSKRMSENEMNFRLWLKKKEQRSLEKKINEQRKVMKSDQERQQRLEESERAYQQWLASSKNKPKPIAPNQGIKSLQSSASVTYINPTPWVPNIDANLKPSSQ
ncbi:DNA ligase 1-like [Onthophagus taurus]|uniref:DNA ligase 1-like n=1 Tax=Onthophagus taurus TaxID=166361 RepID=UPI0039BE09F9